MVNVLLIDPISISGNITFRGLKNAFEELGCNVLLKDVRDLNLEELRNFKPDFSLGYDYSYLINKNDSKNIIDSLNILNTHWFQDDPHTKFANSGNLTLFHELAKTKNVVFCWDKDVVQEFKNKTFYLPVGIDVNAYKANTTSSREIILSFVGRPLTDKRQKILAHVNRFFPHFLKIYCFEIHFDRAVDEMMGKGYFQNLDELSNFKNSYEGFLLNEEELHSVFKNSKMSLNITMEQGKTSMNNRILEVLWGGSFLLTDYTDDVVEYFPSGSGYQLYSNVLDLLAIIKQNFISNPLLSDNKINAKIIEENHTLKHRAMSILEVLKGEFNVL